MNIFSSLARWRQQWRDLHRRTQALEKKLAESDRLIDLLLAQESHSPEQGLGLHGQCGRWAVVNAIFSKLPVSQIVETGTYLGFTAGDLASRFDVPVHSGELLPRYHQAAKMRLRNLPNVRLYNNDSRAFLKQLSADPGVTAGVTLFYLDAHWYKDLPLEDEVRIIAGTWRDFVIVVDDFKVPGDPGYAYDDYGPGRCLELSYLEPVAREFSLSVAFPRLPSSEETGVRAGYAVISSPSVAKLVAEIPLLRPAE